MIISLGLRCDAIAQRMQRGKTFSRLNVQTISDHARRLDCDRLAAVDWPDAGWSSIVFIVKRVDVGSEEYFRSRQGAMLVDGGAMLSRAAKWRHSCRWRRRLV